MNTYFCEFTWKNILCEICFDAASTRVAENVARENGWTIIAVYPDEVPMDVEAMIEKTVTRASIH